MFIFALDRMNFGSVVERGIAEVWASERYESFRGQLNSDQPPEIGRTCAVYNGMF